MLSPLVWHHLLSSSRCCMWCPILFPWATAWLSALRSLYHGCFLGIASCKVQSWRASSLRFYRIANTCQRTLLGVTHCWSRDKLENHSWVLYFIIAGILISSWLLVSEIPMFALKFKHWGFKGNEVKYIFLITCCPLVAIFGISAFAIIVAWYVILSAIVQQSSTQK